jgi:hypothetical protein
MKRNVFLLLVCAAIFLNLMLVTASADKEELLGLDVFVVGHHAYVAGVPTGFMWLISAGRMTPSLSHL